MDPAPEWLTETMSMINLATLEHLSLDRLSILPGSVRTPVLHDRTDEILYISEGELDVYVNQERRIMRAGDAWAVPRGAVHGSINNTADTVIMLALNSPAFDVSDYRDVPDFQIPPLR